MKRLILMVGVLVSAISLTPKLYAKSIEELLPVCIKMSQKLTAEAKIWKAGQEAISEKPRPYEFAVISTSTAKNAMIENTIVPMLENIEAHDTVLREMKRISDEIALRRQLISDMAEEAFANENSFEAMSAFVAECSNNFGGATYTLQDEVDRLETELSEALTKIEEQSETFANLNENNQKAFETEIKRIKNIVDDETRLEMFKLRTEASVKSQKLSALCQWVKANGNTEFLSKRVLIDGYYRLLCD